MATKFYPLHMRRQCLRLLSDGWSARKISAHTSISTATFRNWAREAGVVAGAKISEEELDASIEFWKEKLTEKEGRLDERGRLTNKQLNSHIRRDERKFGTPREEKEKRSEQTSRSWSELQKAGFDPDEWKDHLAIQMERIVKELERAQSPEDQVNALQAGIMLVQLQTIASNPPPTTSWADVERIVKMLRQSLGMDEKEGGGNKEGLDLRIATAKFDGVGNGKVVEINDGKPGRKKRA